MYLKSINRCNLYAIILDYNTGNYYGAQIKDMILIDDYDNCLVEIVNGKRVIVPMRNIYDKCCDMYVALSIANQD